MFGSPWPPFDLRGFMSDLRCLRLCACSDVQHILCCVFVLFVFVLCALWCKFLCIVHFWFPNRYSLKLMYTTTISTHINLHHMDNSFRDPEPFESLHLTFTKKKSLGVFNKVCNSACRSVLNRLWMKTKIQLSIIKFWEHIVNSYNTLIHKIYLATDKNNAAIFLWLSQAMTGFLMFHIVVFFMVHVSLHLLI